MYGILEKLTKIYFNNRREELRDRIGISVGIFDD